MRNNGLLRFLAAVQKHNDTSATLMALTGFDALELQIAVSTAERAGFVTGTGRVHPSLKLTAAGRSWAAEQLSDFEALTPASVTQKAVDLCRS